MALNWRCSAMEDLENQIKVVVLLLLLLLLLLSSPSSCCNITQSSLLLHSPIIGRLDTLARRRRRRRREKSTTTQETYNNEGNNNSTQKNISFTAENVLLFAAVSSFRLNQPISDQEQVNNSKPLPSRCRLLLGWRPFWGFLVIVGALVGFL